MNEPMTEAIRQLPALTPFRSVVMVAMLSMPYTTTCFVAAVAAFVPESFLPAGVAIGFWAGRKSSAMMH